MAKDTQFSALQQAIITNDQRSFERMLQQDPDLARADLGDGMQPLHYAALFNRPEIIAALIHAGGDVAACTDKGQSVLDYAVAQGHITTVGLLLDHGAPVAATAHSSLVLVAVRHGQDQMVPILAKAGADIEALVDGKAPIHWAAESQDLSDQQAFKMIHALVSAGANPALPDAEGRTPADLATSAVRKNLLKNGFGGPDVTRWRQSQPKNPGPGRHP